MCSQCSDNEATFGEEEARTDKPLSRRAQGSHGGRLGGKKGLSSFTVVVNIYPAVQNINCKPTTAANGERTKSHANCPMNKDALGESDYSSPSRRRDNALAPRQLFHPVTYPGPELRTRDTWP